MTLNWSIWSAHPEVKHSLDYSTQQATGLAQISPTSRHPLESVFYLVTAPSIIDSWKPGAPSHLPLVPSPPLPSASASPPLQVRLSALSPRCTRTSSQSAIRDAPAQLMADALSSSFVPSKIPRKRRLQTLAVAIWSTVIVWCTFAFLLLLSVLSFLQHQNLTLKLGYLL